MKGKNLKIVLWVLTIFMIISALVYFPSVASIIMLLFAAIAIPLEPVRNFWREKKLYGLTKGILLTVLFFVSVGMAPTSDKAINDEPTDRQSIQQSEDSRALDATDDTDQAILPDREPTSETNPAVEPEPETEPEPVSAADPDGESEPADEPDTESESVVNSDAESEPVSASGPDLTPEPEPVEEPNPDTAPPENTETPTTSTNPVAPDQAADNSPISTPATNSKPSSNETVYVSKRSNTIHSVNNCGGMKNYREMTRSEADAKGYKYCSNCW